MSRHATPTRSVPAQGQHKFSTRSAHGQHKVSTWSAHGQHMVSTWSAQGQRKASTRSAQDQHKVSTYLATARDTDTTRRVGRVAVHVARDKKVVDVELVHATAEEEPSSVHGLDGWVGLGVWKADEKGGTKKKQARKQDDQTTGRRCTGATRNPQFDQKRRRRGERAEQGGRSVDGGKGFILSFF